MVNTGLALPRSLIHIQWINVLEDFVETQPGQKHVSFFFFNGFLLFFFFSFIFISWRPITSQHCSGFCHTLTRISHGYTCIPHPDPPSPLPLHPIPLGLPSAPGPSTCLMHATWAGDLFHYRWCTCCSLKTSHPRLLPQSPKVCSVHLCLFFCFAHRVIITVFLNSIYMC